MNTVPMILNFDECSATDRDTFICPQYEKELIIRNIYPPVSELQPHVLTVVIIFVICFIVGICGNASVWTIIRGILSERKTSRSNHRRNRDNAILYIAALCVVDFLMSLSLPPAILVRPLSYNCSQIRFFRTILLVSGCSEQHFARSTTFVVPSAE